MPVTTSKVPTLAVVLGAFASFAGFLFGYDTGYISGIKEMTQFRTQFGDTTINGVTTLSTGQDSLLTAIISVGTVVGALFASQIGDRIGRRWAIDFYLLWFALGVALQTAATEEGMFAAGRVFAGLGVGGTSVLVPIYQSECSPKNIRGFVVSAYQFFVTLGLFIAASVVYATHEFSGAASYRIPIGLQFIWGVIIGVGVLFLPESPRYLAMKDNEAGAKKALGRLLSVPADSQLVTEEYNDIWANIQMERTMGTASWMDCFRNGESKTRKRILTGMGIQALQQLSGINFIIYYGTTFFSNIGISNSYVISIIINAVNCGTTIPGMLMVDRLGRRPLMIYGAIGMAISQIIVAGVGAGISTDNEVAQKVLVSFVCIYIAHFASTWGPLAWVITGEIYPAELRAKGMSLSTATQWLLNFGIAYATPYLVNKGPGAAGLGTNVFWIWGGFCIVGVLFAYFFIPETKGLSLEQIDVLYRHSSIRKSAEYGRMLLADNIHDDITAEGAVKTRGRSAHYENGAEPKRSNENVEEV